MKKTALCLMAVASIAIGSQAQTTKPVTKPVTKPITKTAPKTAVKPVVKPVLAPEPLMKNGIDSFSYAVGCNIASSMKDQGINELNIELMKKAFYEVFNNIKTAMTPEEANATLQQKVQEFAKQKSSVEKAKGDAFLAENKKRKGVISLPNGLQYEILTAGDSTGIKPSAADTVVVHYLGTLIDGTKFDASVDRGEPATFPVGGVIRGWTEILQLMTKGAKWKVAIPSELAYGDRGAGGSIAPGAALVFEINLLDIKVAQKQ